MRCFQRVYVLNCMLVFLLHVSVSTKISRSSTKSWTLTTSSNFILSLNSYLMVTYQFCDTSLFGFFYLPLQRPSIEYLRSPIYISESFILIIPVSKSSTSETPASSIRSFIYKSDSSILTISVIEASLSPSLIEQ